MRGQRLALLYRSQFRFQAATYVPEGGGATMWAEFQKMTKIVLKSSHAEREIKQFNISRKSQASSDITRTHLGPFEMVKLRAWDALEPM